MRSSANFTTTGAKNSSATLYDVVGSVKTHFRCAIVAMFFFFPVRIFCFFSTKARTVNPAVDVWFHQPSIRSPATDHDSLFRRPDRSGSKLPNQPSDELAFTRVARELACMRTSRA